MPTTKKYMLRWYGCRANAKRLGRTFLSSEEMKVFWETPHICEYCEITEELWLSKYKRTLEIDRKNNDKGYGLDNITWACHRCNVIKNNLLSYQEMKEIGAISFDFGWQNLTEEERKWAEENTGYKAYIY